MSRPADPRRAYQAQLRRATKARDKAFAARARVERTLAAAMAKIVAAEDSIRALDSKEMQK